MGLRHQLGLFPRFAGRRTAKQCKLEPPGPRQQGSARVGRSNSATPHQHSRLETRRWTLQCDATLMAEKQILRFKQGPRLEHICDETFECVQDRKFCSQRCNDFALRCDRRPVGLFGMVMASRMRHMDELPATTQMRPSFANSRSSLRANSSLGSELPQCATLRPFLVSTVM